MLVKKCICELAVFSSEVKKGIVYSGFGLFFLGEEFVIVSAKIHIQHLEG